MKIKTDAITDCINCLKRAKIETTPRAVKRIDTAYNQLYALKTRIKELEAKAKPTKFSSTQIAMFKNECTVQACYELLMGSGGNTISKSAMNKRADELFKAMNIEG